MQGCWTADRARVGGGGQDHFVVFWSGQTTLHLLLKDLEMLHASDFDTLIKFLSYLILSYVELPDKSFEGNQ